MYTAQPQPSQLIHNVQFVCIYSYINTVAMQAHGTAKPTIIYIHVH